MASRIFVTGLGIITSIGKNLNETLDSLRDSRSGIGKLNFIETIHKDIPVGEVKYSNKELADIAGISDDYGFTRTALLAIIAAKEAAIHSKLNEHCGLRTGVISGTTVGGMDKSEDLYTEFLKDDKKNNIYIETHDCADHTEKIADLINIKDYVATTSTACSSAANSIMFGARMIKNGLLDRAIVGGSECLSRFHINGFNSLKILDTVPCRPFDKNRAGITLGEGAAYLVIESEESIRITGNKPLCELKGYGNSCEAFHQTASSPDGFGAYLAMKQALDMSGLKPEEINYINAHGTGTDNNDTSEGKAIERLFPNAVPPVSSTKSFTGHTTSAAGSVEAIMCILAMNYNMLIPNLNFKEKIEELTFEPVSKLIENHEVRNALSNSFGFGGNNSCLIFSKI
jgi:3-oxoacyl-[acyl-carrier-protein] synthase-1